MRTTLLTALAAAKRSSILPDVRKSLQDAGIEPGGGTPEQFKDFIQSEMVKWAKIAKGANIQPE
jgi:tripartite-type tricarboxylate transporter receptor subunit TctC